MERVFCIYGSNLFIYFFIFCYLFIYLLFIYFFFFLQVVGGLGPEKLHRLMPDIIATAERSDIAPHVKDGYIMMFIFLPTVFQDEFTPYIGQIIPPILKVR